MSKRLTTVSKFISKYLRHEPEALGITLAPGGWVAVDELLAGATQSGFTIDSEELKQVVAESDKQRFAFDGTGTRIRANQGHSTEVDLELPAAVPPNVLFHGTVEKYLDAILAEGLKKMARHHVHLSPDRATAEKVGERRGRPVILVVDAAAMHAAGHKFYVSTNGVWLTDHVPAKYLQIMVTHASNPGV
jgi:putative RNA 2'-phosphotransferase